MLQAAAKEAAVHLMVAEATERKRVEAVVRAQERAHAAQVRMQMEQVRHHSCSLAPNWCNVSLSV
jgi:hypothetical protein